MQKALPNWLFYSFIALTLLGLADSFYLSVQHFRDLIPPCTIGGCETVLTSRFAAIGPVPIAFLGISFYGVLFFLFVFHKVMPERRSIINAIRLTWAGFIVSVFLVIIQIFVINAICQYCMVSAASSGALFILGRIALRKYANAV